MALKMACPWRDPKSGKYYLRQRTPRDLLPRLKGQTVVLPIGDTFASVTVGDMVQASLRTADGREAKRLHAAADAALKRFWEAQRTGPVTLTHKQAHALAGELYRTWAGAAADDPGSLEFRQSQIDADDWADEAEPGGWAGLSIMGAAETRRDKLLVRYGPLLQATLARRGLLLDEQSQRRLLEAVAVAMRQANQQLLRNAEGDYRPDPAAERFPEWVPPSAPSEAPKSAALTVADLFERWKAYHADKKAKNTLKCYSASLRSLAAFAGDGDVRSLTDDDLHRWAEHRRDVDGVSPRAVNKNDLVAASSVFKWAMDRNGGRLMTSNPAKGVHLDEPRVVSERERTFHSAEVSAILRAASAVQIDPKNPFVTGAKRWCPWLAAYSGTRIAELTRLTAEDIRTEAGVHVMDLRETKTGTPRTVPLHEHLVEQGFLEYVACVGKGPLFYDPTEHWPGAEITPAEVRAQQLAAWVREAADLKDPNVDPNHGWRHTWKTATLGAGIDERLRDAITGHSVVAVGRRYEAPASRHAGRRYGAVSAVYGHLEGVTD